MALSFWRNRRVLLTGHTGFKGAWLCLWLERLGAQVVGHRAAAAHRAQFVRDPAVALARPRPSHRWTSATVPRPWPAVDGSKAEIVIHLAAQSLVPAGHRDPPATFATNVMGTVHVLEGALRAADAAARC